MILDSILEASFRFFNFIYKLFEQYFVNNLSISGEVLNRYSLCLLSQSLC